MYRILYVDDEPAVLAATKVFLENSYEFRVDSVASGKEALENLKKNQYDAIVSDYEMPELNGIDLLRIIRDSGSSIPFIIFTGKGREDVVIDALNAGADFYIQKGGNAVAMFAELANHIRQATGRRRAEDETKRNLELLESSYEELTATEEELRQNLDELVQSQKQLRETEEKLRKEKELYENIIEEQTEFVCRFNPDWRYSYVNNAFCEYFDKDREELIGHRFKPAMSKKEGDKIGRLFDSITPDNPVVSFRERTVTPEGRERWQSWNTRAFYDREGKVIQYQSVGRDVTAVVTAEDEVLIKNEELESTYEELAATEEELRQNLDELIQSQKLLREKERLLSDIINFLPDATFVIDMDGKVIAWNQAIEEMTGIPASEMLTKGNYEYSYRIYGERRPLLIDLILNEKLRDEAVNSQIYRSGEKLFAETYISHLRNGEGSYVWGRASPLYDDDGNIIGAIESIRDISDRKKMEFALKESEELYRTIFESTSSPTVILDEDTKLHLVNEEFVRLSGYAREDLEGKKSWTEFVLSEDLEKMKRYHQDRRIDKGSAPRSYEFRFVSKSGKTYDICVTNAVIPGTRHSVASFLDITELKRAERELKESEQRYLNIIEDQTEFVCRFLPDGTHVFVNEAYCDYFGKDREDMIGHRFVPDIPSEDRERLNQFFNSFTPEHPVDSIRHRIIMPDGEVRWQRWSDRAIFDDEGNIIEYQSVGRDVTDTIKSEEVLRSVNKKLKLLSSITRHDILNQITALSTYEELLKNHIKDETTAGFIEQMIESTRRIEQQIIFTRDYQDLGLKSPAWQKIDTLARLAVMPTVARLVDVDIETGTLEVFADPMLEKVFLNLFDNAIRHGEGVSSVGIWFEERDDMGVIVFQDNGVGVADNMKEKIFLHGVGSNTGFGLFLVREILDITGISIREAGMPGKGARFEIIIPDGLYRFAN